MSKFLEDRVIVITGAGGGIGAAIARRVAAEGAKVVVNDLGVWVDGTPAVEDAPSAQRVVDEIKVAGGEAVANGGDVSSFTDARDLIQSARDVFGKLDVVINVAGILRDEEPLWNMSEAAWDDVIRVDLKGTFNTCRFAAEYWHELDDSSAHHRIINFTSSSGLYGSALQPNYAAAKMGIVGFTFSCAKALGQYGVTANAVWPSANTRRHERRRSDDKWAWSEEWRKVQTRSNERTPENVAPTVAYLASTRSDWCTGRVLNAHGHRVTIYKNHTPEATIVSNEDWDLDRLADTVEAMPNLEVRGDDGVLGSEAAGPQREAKSAAS